MKKFLTWIAAVALLLSACGSEGSAIEASVGPEKQVPDDGVTTVGICLPARDGRWEREGQALAEALDVGNYAVELLYADNDPLLQADQMEKLIAADVECLVVVAVDSLTLTDALIRAKSEGIPVIAYDRLLMQTDGATCHIAFDMLGAGKSIGEYIVQEKQLASAKEESRSYTIEFFMGTPEDNNALLLHRGIREVLQPYLDSGVLTCTSGRVRFEDCCIQDWSAAGAEEACDRLLREYYAETQPDILCAASDSLADGVFEALQTAGYTEGFLLTGQGAEATAVERLQLGAQGLTLYPDTQALVRQCAQAVDALLRGKQPEYNDTDTCFNGNVTVPAYLLSMQVVTTENDTQILPEGTYVPVEEETQPTETN